MAATGEERGRVAGQLLSQAIIEDKMVIAVVPRSEVALFFKLLELKSSDAATGVTRGGIDCGISTEATGIEPAISALTGLHVNHYTTPPQRSR